MNNDKPKDDDWAMSNPNICLNDEKEENESSENFPPQKSQTSDEDWAMTTPKTNLGQHLPPTDDYGKTVPNVNIPQADWEITVPENKPPISSSLENWEMTVPNKNLSEFVPRDSDKTAPNLEIPSEVFKENPPQQQETVNEEWLSSMPYIAPRKEKKEGEWEMPQPVFRVTSGRKPNPQQPQNQPEHQTDVPIPTDFFDQTTPFVEIAASEDKAGVPTTSFPNKNAPSAAAPVKKKRSIIPLLVGGVFAFFLFSIAALAGVYLLFLRGGSEMASKSSNVSQNSNSASSVSEKPVTSDKIAANSATTAENILPKQIEYKGTTMMLVPAGTFTMGSNSGEETSKPAHQIENLPAYYIDKTEVTNAEYKKFCDETGRSTPPIQDWNKEYFQMRPNAPVIGISFEDAKAFAEWAGKRLPTEAEWEKAASWDEAKKTKYEFPWGNRFESANAAFNIVEPADVGKYPEGASPFGVLDMAGNVAEWVDSFFKAYPNSNAKDENFGEINRVVRGGHFDSKSSDRLKTTRRVWIPPGFTASPGTPSYIGFRCAISADDPRLKEILSK